MFWFGCLWPFIIHLFLQYFGHTFKTQPFKISDRFWASHFKKLDRFICFFNFSVILSKYNVFYFTEHDNSFIFLFNISYSRYPCHFIYLLWRYVFRRHLATVMREILYLIAADIPADSRPIEPTVKCVMQHDSWNEQRFPYYLFPYLYIGFKTTKNSLPSNTISLSKSNCSLIIYNFNASNSLKT